MLKLRSTIEMLSPDFSISYRDPIMAIGSCFAQQIGQKLKETRYQMTLNPFGVLYNPISIRNSVALLLNDYRFVEDDLFYHKGLWHSFQHHSRFSKADKEACLLGINKQLDKARLALEDTKVLILTLGTAWVYELAETGKVVSNCHKLPANTFYRKRLSVDEILDSMGGLLEYLKVRLPDLKVVLTVSPVRHLKDGFSANQVSKATLLLVVQELCEQLDYVQYFPAYEIMMDDLRDYRFYEADLVHPNSVAIEYIWEQFERYFLLEEEAEWRKQMQQLQAALTHRPFNPRSEAHQRFVKQQLTRLEQYQEKLPFLEFEDAQTYFQNQLITDT